MIQVKICGITNKNEIKYLNILKPEYMGFVFAKSKRQVTVREAKQLSNNLDKQIKIVGVFKDNSIDEILDVINILPLNIIQLHGKEDENFISSLKARVEKSVSIWKALSISDAENIRKYADHKYRDLIDNILIDGDKPGSGETFPLEDICELLKVDSNKENNYNLTNNTCSFFLAGGITPENVAERIVKVSPYGIDVSSGVEITNEDGTRIKSFEKMRSLIEKVRAININ
ncbi:MULTISPECIES: phosphoribosylanthranilate isomerase [Clostridium]|uniref:N-(5'-phosphoribosyl)anthranilate isomerase n=1 Tax=Clostridium beijerinckii TaxID=1520 RepID=A0A0B5Q8F6_CLOBE|nr:MULTISPECIES: phosphoribosylanthranilate isomerase [Clostridium]AJG98494.1 N-(5'-phosphoribosyl)anthranilate isomerase [Clostridium beijerinckii]AQS04371.1 N-(5'-phosphoribosyl)anthranilate isomerase [Clostridium beijerinckii]MBA2883736.1 phosphoribosylanthranilate isomerase [Clostridium beijerinckii]MBA2898922.1 phosphoribosylanthranilate isomerase [Clostridium beijerinckii]MBA2908322.1 phosphoribosylanthranilate isomerase [Clostridium beijerinckii]